MVGYTCNRSTEVEAEESQVPGLLGLFRETVSKTTTNPTKPKTKPNKQIQNQSTKAKHG